MMLTFAQIAERCRDTLDQFNWIFRNAVGKGPDGLVQLLSNWFSGKSFKGLDQGMSEAMETVAVLQNCFPLHLVDHASNLLPGHLLVVEK